MPEDETLASPEAVDELSRSVGISKEALRIFLGVCWVAFGFNLVDKRRGVQNPSSFILEANSKSPLHTKENKRKNQHRKGPKESSYLSRVSVTARLLLLSACPSLLALLSYQSIVRFSHFSFPPPSLFFLST